MCFLEGCFGAVIGAIKVPFWSKQRIVWRNVLTVLSGYLKI